MILKNILFLLFLFVYTGGMLIGCSSLSNLTTESDRKMVIEDFKKIDKLGFKKVPRYLSSPLGVTTSNLYGYEKAYDVFIKDYEDSDSSHRFRGVERTLGTYGAKKVYDPYSIRHSGSGRYDQSDWAFTFTLEKGEDWCFCNTGSSIFPPQMDNIPVIRDEDFKNYYEGGGVDYSYIDHWCIVKEYDKAIREARGPSRKDISWESYTNVPEFVEEAFGDVILTKERQYFGPESMRMREDGIVTTDDPIARDKETLKRDGRPFEKVILPMGKKYKEYFDGGFSVYKTFELEFNGKNIKMEFDVGSDLSLKEKSLEGTLSQINIKKLAFLYKKQEAKQNQIFTSHLDLLERNDREIKDQIFYTPKQHYISIVNSMKENKNKNFFVETKTYNESFSGGSSPAGKADRFYLKKDNKLLFFVFLYRAGNSKTNMFMIDDKSQFKDSVVANKIGSRRFFKGDETYQPPVFYHDRKVYCRVIDLNKFSGTFNRNNTERCDDGNLEPFKDMATELKVPIYKIQQSK